MVIAKKPAVLRCSVPSIHCIALKAVCCHLFLVVEQIIPTGTNRNVETQALLGQDQSSIFASWKAVTIKEMGKKILSCVVSDCIETLSGYNTKKAFITLCISHNLSCDDNNMDISYYYLSCVREIYFLCSHTLKL